VACCQAQSTGGGVSEGYDAWVCRVLQARAEGRMAAGDPETKRAELDALGRKLASLRSKLIPPPAPDPNPPPLFDVRCPACGGDCESGTVQADGTAWGFFWIGFSYSPLWFWRRTESSSERRRILDPRETRSSACCTQCGTVVIQG
jgi:hypothetical protein